MKMAPINRVPLFERPKNYPVTFDFFPYVCNEVFSCKMPVANILESLYVLIQCNILLIVRDKLKQFNHIR